ncbi:MAG: phosphoribosylanthranilate isomerase [Prevotellaceae bacterium]|jgi:phosphoribosylanthranilate isomerase|nr:phosphoribosylanthranilate isomerase [Prevotellaceae bacterium]
MKIKVCGMCKPKNIAEIATLNPDYMGFIFYKPSPRFVENLDPVVLDLLPANTAKVGVFVDAPLDYALQQAETYRFDFLQLHGHETLDYCAGLKNKYAIIKTFGIDQKTDFAKISEYENVCNYFLFDTKTELYGGSGKKFDHSLLDAYRGKTPFFLSGGISPHDANIVSHNCSNLCNAIDVNSRFEITPGIKDFNKIKTFIEIIRNNK